MNSKWTIALVTSYIIAFIYFLAGIIYDLWKGYNCSLGCTITSGIFGMLFLIFVISILLGIFIYKKDKRKKVVKE